MNKKLLRGLFHSAFLLLMLTACTRQAENKQNGTNIPPDNSSMARAGGNEELVTTIAAIKKLANGDAEYRFNERQSVYVVSVSNPVFERVLTLATNALRNKKPVKLFSSGYSNLVDLAWPSAAETNAYMEWYRLKIADPDADRTLYPNELDSFYFNTASWQNWKAFRLCVKTVPSLLEAKAIFNYCAAQGCYLGPTQVQPCIPFQYVRDGCFARAHKMRWIIQTKFGYCSEKVFSYGDLNVRADKWGGCCVSWWYHVAPLLRVKNGAIVYCYVIDPGMFNEPVLLSTWLKAQANKSCSPYASVTSYSIQPSSAYTPSYTTDPNYTTTNTDLVIFNNAGSTCGN